MSHLYQGPLYVYYCQAYMGDPEHYAALDECFAGQTNGLCGAAAPGQLHLCTGLYCGDVHITVDVREAAPPLDLSAWEEVVEATFIALPDRAVVLYDWYRNTVCELPLKPGTYRVRYCARNMDAAHALDTLVDGEPVDSYALIFWPAPPAPDTILKQTSQDAAYRHRAFCK